MNLKVIHISITMMFAHTTHYICFSIFLLYVYRWNFLPVSISTHFYFVVFPFFLSFPFFLQLFITKRAKKEQK